MNDKDFIKAVDLLEKEKGIARDIIISSLQEALERAYKKDYGDNDALVKVDINDKAGTIKMFHVKKIVEEVEDDLLEISLEDAQQISPTYQIGEDFLIPIDTDKFKRIAAIQAQQVLKQKIKEAEKNVILSEFLTKKEEIITGIIETVDDTKCVVKVGKATTILYRYNCLPTDKLIPGEIIKMYLADVLVQSKGSVLVVTRTDPNFLKKILENEITEIYDGTVEINILLVKPESVLK